MAINLNDVREVLADLPAELGAETVYLIKFEGAELAQVWAYDEDHAMELAIEAWVDCGGDYTEGLTVEVKS